MGTTANLGLPYPEGTDLVVGGDDAIQALAEAVEDRIYSGTTVAQIEPAESASSTGTDVEFPGTQTLMIGFAYAAGVLTYIGAAPRTFIIAAEVEVQTATDAALVQSTAHLRVSGVAIAGSVDRVESASTITERMHTHRLVAPRTLSYGDTVTVLTTASPAGTIGVTALSVYPIGPSAS